MAKKKTVFIELTSAVVFGGKITRAGNVVECSDAQAKDLLHRGRGKLAAADNVEDDGDEKALSEHTVDELRHIADELEIDNVSSMKKAALIAAIEKAEAEDDGAGDE